MHILAFLNFWFWEKKDSRIFFWAIGVPKKNYKFSKNIEKTPYRSVAQKRYNFAPGAANHTFFDSPCIVLLHSVVRKDYPTPSFLIFSQTWSIPAGTRVNEYQNVVDICWRRWIPSLELAHYCPLSIKSGPRSHSIFIDLTIVCRIEVKHFSVKSFSRTKIVNSGKT